MPSSTKTSSSGKSGRGRSQDRKLVAGGQEHEVKYEARKTGTPQAAVKSAIKSAGNSRRAVEKALRSK